MVGAASQAELDVVEADLVAVRQVELARHPVRFTADLDHLQVIHRRLFQDVYDWAGKLRTVDIAKSRTRFLPVSMLVRSAGYLFAELAEDRMLRGLSRDPFIERLAHHYDQLNYLHPFREGNGRAQRVFWTQVSARAGWVLDFKAVTGEANDRASRVAAERHDLGPLIEMFDQIVRAGDRQGPPSGH